MKPRHFKIGDTIEALKEFDFIQAGDIFVITCIDKAVDYKENSIEWIGFVHNYPDSERVASGKETNYRTKDFKLIKANGVRDFFCRNPDNVPGELI